MSKETNQIAELNAEMWVVVNPKGLIIYSTIHVVKEKCIKNAINEHFTWEECKELGYRCIPVSVNIKPIEQ